VIEELAPEGLDEALDVTVHLRRANGSLDGPNAQRARSYEVRESRAGFDRSKTPS
jgi:hypothetical protein